MICLDDLVFLLVWDLTASGFALVSKEWYTKHGMTEKIEIVVSITRHLFPLLTTSKSVIIKDPHGAKKTCISIIGDHPGFRPKN